MEVTISRSIDHNSERERRRCCQIERRFSAQRQARELVRDLLRAHSSS